MVSDSLSLHRYGEKYLAAPARSLPAGPVALPDIPWRFKKASLPCGRSWRQIAV